MAASGQIAVAADSERQRWRPVRNKGEDALLLAEPQMTTFVNYLRIAFQRGGFPGWERGLRDGWAQPATRHRN